MPYDNITTRAETAPLVPEEVSRAMLGRVREETSAVMRVFRNVPVARTQVRFPILSALPIAYWVNGDTGQKQTTEMAWTNKYLNVEEIAVIAPLPENVVDDLANSGIDVWGEIRPEIEIAMGRALDAAVFFGVNAPATFPTNISAAALAAANSYTETAAASAGGFMDDLDATIGLVEADGYDPTAIVAARSLKGRARRARNSQGDRLEGFSASLDDYMGLGISYPMRGLFPSGGGGGTNVRAFVGDFTEFVIGIRSDISFKLLDQAVIQDADGNIVYNLAQQDMVAARFTFRAGWQVSNRINRDQPTESDRYPVARLMF